MSVNTCYHCGLDCGKTPINFNEKCFCCNGCKTVYEILNQNELSCYYDMEKSPGTVPNEIKGKYDYLENEEIAQKILEFADGTTSVVEFYIPSIHCAACIWVLENLEKLNSGIVNSIVNFPNKTVRITFKSQSISLKQVVELLTSIAYEPYISLEDANKNAKKNDKTLLYQLGYAAFAFGNVMLLAFPEYFEKNDEFWLNQYKYMFRYMMLVLSIPVVVYSAKDYFLTAFKGLRKGILSVDVPLALGIFVLFARSTYETFIPDGQVYFDSLTGLVFFLLLGRYFQQKTYDFLSFERDYRSYFPIAVTKINNGIEENIPVQDAKEGDRLLIRNEELIPVDGILIHGEAYLDYSFVTGESVPVYKSNGEKVYAGGKQKGSAIEIDVINKISESYLTELWSNDVFNKDHFENDLKTITNNYSKYFTVVVLLIATFAGIYWFTHSSYKAIEIVTAVLIVACPCALALSAPFAVGNMLRIFGYKKFYLKNALIIERLNRIKHIVFDKTGTITTNDAQNLTYEGEKLNEKELKSIKTLIRSSNHPLSRTLNDAINVEPYLDKIDDYEEVLGKGIIGNINGMSIRIGSASFVDTKQPENQNTMIFIKINNEVKGYFRSKNVYRNETETVFTELSKKYKISILSGDNDGEKNYLESILPKNTPILFHQSPQDKLEYIKKLQEQGDSVLMIGDGLNDAGALAQSDVGIAISENVNVFSPACDGIISAKLFNNLPKFLTLSQQTIKIVKWSFKISFLYNIIGLYFAVTGQLTPIVAAILMPLSSISIVAFVTFLTNFAARKKE